jgi:hypothetical protein
MTLQYKDGAQKILVPDGVPITTSVPGDRSLLVPGAYVFMVAQVAPDGTLSVARIQVSKDGVKPSHKVPWTSGCLSPRRLQPRWLRGVGFRGRRLPSGENVRGGGLGEGR